MMPPATINRAAINSHSRMPNGDFISFASTRGCLVLSAACCPFEELCICCAVIMAGTKRGSSLKRFAPLVSAGQPFTAEVVNRFSKCCSSRPNPAAKRCDSTFAVRGMASAKVFLRRVLPVVFEEAVDEENHRHHHQHEREHQPDIF